ncbi:hypothetical protein Ancab_036085 [Ancistrocladus abbreviatus]
MSCLRAGKNSDKQITSMQAKFDELKQYATEKDSLIKSTQLQLSDAKDDMGELEMQKMEEASKAYILAIALARRSEVKNLLQLLPLQDCLFSCMSLGQVTVSSRKIQKMECLVVKLLLTSFLG